MGKPFEIVTRIETSYLALGISGPIPEPDLHTVCKKYKRIEIAVLLDYVRVIGSLTLPDERIARGALGLDNSDGLTVTAKQNVIRKLISRRLRVAALKTELFYKITSISGPTGADKFIVNTTGAGVSFGFMVALHALRPNERA